MILLLLQIGILLARCRHVRRRLLKSVGLVSMLYRAMGQKNYLCPIGFVLLCLTTSVSKVSFLTVGMAATFHCWLGNTATVGGASFCEMSAMLQLPAPSRSIAAWCHFLLAYKGHPLTERVDHDLSSHTHHLKCRFWTGWVRLLLFCSQTNSQTNSQQTVKCQSNK